MSDPIRILLVEDNRGDADLMEELIKETGFSYVLNWVNDGQKAIDFFEEGNEADVILLDLNLPKVGGHEVLAFLNDMGVMAKVPVIIMTGSSFQGDIDQTMENGATCYILKPMSFEEIEKATMVLKDIFSGLC
ncbi:MAG: response regulator [Methanomassiliicoccales archaeon]|jgi:CheY-like chemotaxis protein